MAQSQPKTPSAGVNQGTDQQSQAQTTQDQRGTDAAPLVVRIPKTPDEAAQIQKDRENQTTIRNWTIGLGILTFLVGVGQLFLIAKQARIAAGQNEIIRMQNEIMTGQREAADTQSGYMRDGLAETKKAAEAALLSANVALKTLRSQRAVLSFTNYKTVKFPTTRELGMPEISVRMWNSGTFTANLIEYHSGVFVGKSLRPAPNYYYAEGSGGVHVPSHGGHTKVYGLPLTDDLIATILDGKNTLYYYAVQTYNDGFEERRVGFCVRYDAADHRWYIAGGAAYNYAD